MSIRSNLKDTRAIGPGHNILTVMIRLTREQVREIDRLSIARYHIPGIVLMENAARAVADVAWEMIGRTRGRCVRIDCGPGNNGGDGLAVARHLHNRGAIVDVSCAAAGSREYAGDAAMNYQIATAMGLIDRFTDRPPPDLIVDALFGTGLDRPLAGEAAVFVDSINRSGVPVLAVDIPSGLDCDTGEPLGPCVRANCTVTFVAEKAGLANPLARQYLGEITIGDIGCPQAVIQHALQIGVLGEKRP